uniref:Uncharacterized protein n=1 Tax=Ananas comosus var. bracteatus TaxID=296719 RepID=A0A6V7PD21_ANACO|nr:unnamed protein product [Ananas comosus var. bracteatus]
MASQPRRAPGRRFQTANPPDPSGETKAQRLKEEEIDGAWEEGGVWRGMLPLLGLHVANEYYRLGRKPPVTAGLILANTLIYLRPGLSSQDPPHGRPGLLQPPPHPQVRRHEALLLISFLSHGRIPPGLQYDVFAMERHPTRNFYGQY